MPPHRRKWGWWLVAALAVILAASLLLFRRRADVPSAPPAPSACPDPAGPVPVVRDTVFVEVDDVTVPVVRERKVRPEEVPGEDTPSEVPVQQPVDPFEETPSEEPLEEAPIPVETVVTVPVQDISGLVRQKTGRDISLATQAPDRISVTYAGKVTIPRIGEQTMNLTARFRIVEVQGDRLVLQLDSGAAMNVAADVIAPLVLERLPAGLVESFSSGRAVINLSAIPQLKEQLQSVQIVGFSIDENAIRLRTVEK